MFLKKLAKLLSEKWWKQMNEQDSRVRLRMQSAHLRAASACIRGTTGQRGEGWQEGGMIKQCIGPHECRRGRAALGAGGRQWEANE
mmetsp:Transcript_12131/g.23444  ORF Transcript_12131/g.23444 Transcript_12131/m.23444 type:complete len:86 (+) Transcript_12131:376-633(+)